MPQQQLKVMISSTARDLPEHRKKVMDACMRLGMFYPDMMEHLTATNANALEVSLRIADRADVYVGVFAFHYGYVPDGEAISVTEAEYERAVERDIPRLIFLMSDAHDIKPGDVETGDGAAKLTKLKERLKKERVVGFFDSADDLKAQVIQALVPYRESDVTTFHYVSDIPPPPEPFIAHPYTLLQTPNLIGRQRELKLLTDWITGKELEADGRKAPSNSVRIMNIVAIGGLGKSALTWKWFNDIAPEEMKPLTGRMWWSFYESDATFENFVTRALAYVTKRPLNEVQRIPAPERETQLLATLDHQPFLLALDGLERILIAYARMDAARLDDSEVGKDKNLRKTADPRVGNFLKKLAQSKNSRILISSRLYPAGLETGGGDPIPSSFRCDITGLTDEDAVELWRAFGVSGSRDELLPAFSTFGKHPLLVQALAGEVKRYRRAPGNFERWRKANPKFDPAKFPELAKAMAHVLEFALRSLDKKVTRVLHTISAFRMPATYDTLNVLLVAKGKNRFELRTGKLINEEGRLFDEEASFDKALSELEDRGLVGWDKRANRYDLHPIVRGVVWNALADNTRHGIYSILHAHFEILGKKQDWKAVKSLEDLTSGIELYNTLIGLGQYDDAYLIFRDRLDKPLSYRLSANRQSVELLEMLFANGLGHAPRLNNPAQQAYTLNALAMAYHLSGRPERAASFHHRSNIIRLDVKDDHNFNLGLGNLAIVQRLLGALYESESTFRNVLIGLRMRSEIPEEAQCQSWLGYELATRGATRDANITFTRALNIIVSHRSSHWEGFVSAKLCQLLLWAGNAFGASSLADRACELAQHPYIYEEGLIEGIRLQGQAALALNHLVTADERLHHALSRARLVNLVEDELPALVALAELRRRREDLRAAREFLDDVWESAERGPYPLFHADAFNVLTQIERDEGNTAAAIEAATKAYRLAWCDGPPFAYHWGLEKATQHLKELGAPEPELPPFDESKFEQMPEVEIDPDDEFHVGTVSHES